MKSLTLFAVAAMAMTAVAQPKHRHQVVHDKRAIEKRDILLFTEMVVVTEVVNVTTTVVFADNETPQTIFNAIDTAPHTTILGPKTIADNALKGGVFVENPNPVQTSSDVVPSSAPAIIATTAAPPTKTQEPKKEEPKIEVPSAQPSVPVQSAQSSSGGGGGGGNLYGLAMPPGTQDRASTCSSSSCTGKASYYDNLTDEMACGYNGMVGKDMSMRIIALPAVMMGPSSNANGPGLPNQPINGNCGRMVEVKCAATGKTTTVQVVDKCPGCSGQNIDLSEAAFAALDVHKDTGIVQVEWHFVN